MRDKTLNGKSLNITEEKLARLRELLPEAFSEGQVDWEKLRIALGGEGEFSDERYHLNWAGKTDAFRSLQAPTTATLAPCPEESVNFDGSDNVFIEGENMEALKILQKSYFGKVKMIYIDPPYNTGNDHFIYPDRFAESKDAYLKRVGDRDEQGFMTRAGLFRKNNRENGHFHSNWLSMIYPRLFLARNLLRDDGVIFVSIDDNEVHNLRMVMNEIFGEENFTASIAWQGMDTIKNDATHFSSNCENILVYSKNLNKIHITGIKKTEKQRKTYKNYDNDPRGDYLLTPLHAKSGNEASVYDFTFPNGQTWRAPAGRYPSYSIKSLKELVDDGRIYLDPAGKKTPQKKTYWNETGDRMRPPTFWRYEQFGSTRQANSELRELLGRGKFDNPKPIQLIRQIVDLIAGRDSIILDFFAGSCTTAHAVMQLNAEDDGNRRFICAQMPEACDDESEAFKAGYKTIADIGKERIRQVIKNDDLDVGFKVFKLQDSNFKLWRGDEIRDEKELEKQLKMHATSIVNDAKIENILYELLLKSGFPLTALIETRNGWFMAQDGEATLALALERIDKRVIKAILAAAPQKFITLDHLFENNDQLKTNTALQMEDAGIAFDVV